LGAIKQGQFQVSRNPDVKYSVAEQFAIGCINISLTKITTGISTFFQNLSGPTTTRFTWRRAWRRRECPIRTSSRYGRGWMPGDAAFASRKPRFAEQNFSTEIFRIAKVIERRPRPLYELEDLNGTLIEGQSYQEDLPGFASRVVQSIR